MASYHCRKTKLLRRSMRKLMSYWMQSEHLLDYAVVDLAKLTKSVAKAFLAKAQNRAYELHGQCDAELLLPLFLRLRSIATEITYRPADSPTAYLISTQLDETITLRPGDVQPVVQFSEDELTEFEQQQFADTEQDIIIDLTMWWEEAKQNQSTEPAEAFLRTLYAHAQAKQSVHLTGEVPVTLLLLAVNWFAQLATTQLFYNDNRLQ